MLGGHDGVGGVHLVRRHHVDDIDGGVAAQTLRVVVRAAAEVALEPPARRIAGVGDGHDAGVGVGAQLGDHVHRARAEADDAEVEWGVGGHGMSSIS